MLLHIKRGIYRRNHVRLFASSTQPLKQMILTLYINTVIKHTGIRYNTIRSDINVHGTKNGTKIRKRTKNKNR